MSSIFRPCGTLRGAVLGLIACFGFAATASAQLIPADPGSANKVLSVTLVRDDNPLDIVSGTISADCGSIVNILAQWTHPVSDPFTYFTEWTNMTTNDVVSDPRLLMTAPHDTTTFRYRVYNFDNGKWGEAFLTIASEDLSAPNITLQGPFEIFVNCGSPYVEAGWSVSDNCDSSADIQVSVAGQVDNHSVGAYVLTYTATDSHNNSASVDRTVRVMVPWSGFSEPVDPIGRSIFKLGSTIPLRFQVVGDCSCVANIQPKLYLAKITGAVLGTEIEGVSMISADSGNTFRLVNGTYAFNLSTKGLSMGTWQLRVDLGDNVVHAAQISLF